MRALVLGALLPLLVLLVWHRASLSVGTLVPTIGEVVGVLSHPFSEPNLYSTSLGAGALISVTRVILGFLLAVLLGVPLGVAVGRSRICREVLSPMVELLRPICPVAVLPVLILVLGDASVGSMLYGADAWKHDFADQLPFAMVVVIWWGAFFPIFLNTVHGVNGVKGLYVEVARANGATEFQVFRHIVLPASLPAIVAGLRIGIGVAWMVIVAAEFYPGTKGGLAYMITTAEDYGSFEYVFACILVIGVLGLVTNGGLRRLEERVGRWQARER